MAGFGGGGGGNAFQEMQKTFAGVKGGGRGAPIRSNVSGRGLGFGSYMDTDIVFGTQEAKKRQEHEQGTLDLRQCVSAPRPAAAAAAAARLASHHSSSNRAGTPCCGSTGRCSRRRGASRRPKRQS